MKNLKRIVIAAIMVFAFTVPASAQFAWGPKVGINVNSLKADLDMFNTDNRAGFTGGLTAEFMFPILNLGVDASVMYVHRSNEVEALSKDYIEIPINLKWKIGLPIAGNIVAPYIFTGPSFSVLASKKEITEAWESKSVDVAWNIGLGVQLFRKLQIGASYGFGITNTLNYVGVDNIGGVGLTDKIEGKNNYWTITAAWLF